MGNKKDPFKVDFDSGKNLETEEKSEINAAVQENAETPDGEPLSKRELRRQKRRERELKRIADRKFEREAGLIGVKRASLTLGVIGFMVSIVPVILYVGATLLFITMGLATAVLFMLCLVGFIFIIPFYLAGGGNSIENYFAFALAPANFATDVFNTVSGFSGTLNVVCSAAGILMEIVAAVLLCVSYKALCRKNRIKRTVFLSAAFIISAVVLVFSLVNFS